MIHHYIFAEEMMVLQIIVVFVQKSSYPKHLPKANNFTVQLIELGSDSSNTQCIYS